MLKFGVFVLFVLAVAVQGYPTRYNDIASAAVAGDWDEVHRILAEMYRTNNGFTSLPSNNGFGTADVRSLKPVKGGQVYGEAEYTFQQATNNNGVVNSRSGGHKVINDNGKVTEYDFQPKGIQAKPTSSYY